MPDFGMSLSERLPEDVIKKLNDIKSSRLSIELDKFATKQPLANLPSEKVELHTIDLDEAELAREHTKIKHSESYKILKDDYLHGKISYDEINDYIKYAKFYNIFEGQDAKNKDYISPDTKAAQLLKQQIDAGEIKRQLHTNKYKQLINSGTTVAENITQTKGATIPLENEINKIEHNVALENSASMVESTGTAAKFNEQVFELLSQWSIKGMTDKQIEERLLVKPEQFVGPTWIKDLMSDPAWGSTVFAFLKQRREGNFNPAALKLFEAVLAQPKLGYKDLNAQNLQESERNFMRVTRQVWENFVYSGKMVYNSSIGKYELTSEADLDAKLSLMLLERAGIKDVVNAKPIEPGKIKLGSTMLDVGGDSGVNIKEGVAIGVKDGAESKIEIKSPSTVIIDNHQQERDIIETSTSKEVFNLLEASGLLKGSPEYMEKLKILVEMSVADDNAKLITTREQFDASAHNLRGLHRYFKDANALYRMVELVWRPGMTLDQLLDMSVPHKLVKDFKLGKNINKWEKIDGKPGEKRNTKLWIDADVDQQNTIDQAKKFLDKPEDELKREGRLIDSPKLGKCIVFINEKLAGGHDAVKAYFGEHSAFINIDTKANSFLINTNDEKVDVSEVFHGFKQGTAVRGTIFIKPRGGEPLKVGPQDILKQVGIEEEQIKEFLESRSTGKKAIEKKKVSENESVSELKQKKEAKFEKKDYKQVDYLTVPAQEGYFWADKMHHNFDSLESVFELLRDGKDSITAEYIPVEDPYRQRIIIESYTTYLSSASADIDGTNTRGTYIEVLSPGELKLEGDKWIVIKKVKVRITDGPPKAEARPVAVNVAEKPKNIQPVQVNESKPEPIIQGNKEEEIGVIENKIILPTDFKLGRAYHSKSGKYVMVSGYKGFASDNKHYVTTENNNSSLPFDEIDYEPFFNRELTTEEREKKEVIDDKFRQALNKFWHEELRKPIYAFTNEMRQIVVAQQIEKSMKSPKTQEILFERYKKYDLPI